MLLPASPAEAGRLQSWEFSTRENRLTFTTDESVLPSVQLVPDPTRLVIDLPGTTLGRSRVNQLIGGSIREVRVAQFNAQTTRIVIELNPGYTLDPEQVQVQGSTNENWTVQLPAPQQSEVSFSSSASNRPSASLAQADAVVDPADVGTQLEGVRITQDGFFFRTTGEKPNVVQEYSDDRRQLTLELEDTALSPRLTDRDIAVDRYQVSRIQLAPMEGKNPPAVQIVLELTADAPEWRATATNLGGVVLVPTGGLAAAPPGDRTSQSLTNPTRQTQSVAEPRIPVTLPSADRSNTDLMSTPIELPDVSDRRVRIAIDPGHGGRDPGAVGINGLQEKIVVLDISQKVAQLLEQQGAQVILTRRDDTEIELEPRVRDANQGNANLFVSIHANAIDLDHPGTNGTETYYYSSSAGYQLAQTIQTSVAEGTGMRNIGVKEARFYVLRNTHMPAALVEVGFVTGQVDAPRLADPVFRERMAEAIARGILQYVQQRL
ncbi:MAG: N-acetylmuramoyl-L-alanine amidase [Oscillatoriophycideae cyanobacterium NC_groundwater_1537_Pr4_S-0.65um_50_18]|nr:N-acetylmuramoyl-L-alanine amidase [Oscillatoriophycideae cyanobacterium NC_groundwater_1537_Pr4_S-0.65um_50_18]